MRANSVNFLFLFVLVATFSIGCGNPEIAESEIGAGEADMESAWKKAKFETGWMGAHADEKTLIFRGEIAGDLVPPIPELFLVRAFMTSELNPEVLNSMPAPDHPFGLDLFNSKDRRIANSDLETLAKFGNLIYLSLSQMQIMDTDVKELAKLQHLQALDISGTQITDTGIKELANLKKLILLDLSENPITDKALVELAEFDKLAMLHLRDCKQITAPAVAELQKALPNCKIFRVAKSTFTVPGKK